MFNIDFFCSAAEMENSEKLFRRLKTKLMYGRGEEAKSGKEIKKIIF
jgi:hypothetical protein